MNLATTARILAPVLAVLAASPAAAAFDIATPFNTASASTQQGLLQRGPNQSCISSDPAHTEPFQFRNNDPDEDHPYESYDLYNNGPARCARIVIYWDGADCGDPELGLLLYEDSFNPADPTENFLASIYESHTSGTFEGFLGIAGDDPGKYRYSPGFYRAGGFLGQDYHLDGRAVWIDVGAYSKVVAVIATTRKSSDPDTSCSTARLASDDLALSPLGFEVDDADTNEGNAVNHGVLEFRVSLPAAPGEEVSVDYSTTPGTAFAGSDYSTTSGTVTFAPGETVKYVDVDVVGDPTIEDPEFETMTFTLSNPNPASIPLTAASATGEIQDDDTPACRIDSPESLPHGKVGEPYPAVDMVPIGKESSDDYEWTLVGGALPPGLGLGTFVGGDGEVHGTITGTPTQAGVFDFTVRLDCPQLDNGHDVTDTPLSIVIDSSLPQLLISLGDDKVTEGNEGLTPALPQVNLSIPAPGEITLRVRTIDLSATEANADYLGAAVDATLTIPQGVTSVPLPLDVVGDLTPEDDEAFLVQLRTVFDDLLVDAGVVIVLNDDQLVSVVEVPTLGPGALAALAAGLGVLALRRIRRR